MSSTGTRAYRRLALRAAGWLVFCVVVAGWWIFLRPDSLGGPASYVTVSGTSMLPVLEPGDLVVTTRAESYGIGDIVTYRVPADHPAAGAKVIHRVIGYDESGRLLVQGDNTNGLDVWHPTQADVVGRLWFTIPDAGRAMAILRQPALMGALAAGIAVWWLLGRPAGGAAALAKPARAGELARAR